MGLVSSENGWFGLWNGCNGCVLKDDWGEGTDKEPKPLVYI